MRKPQCSSRNVFAQSSVWQGNALPARAQTFFGDQAVGADSALVVSASPPPPIRHRRDLCRTEPNSRPFSPTSGPC
jgi:hypothetical protein